MDTLSSSLVARYLTARRVLQAEAGVVVHALGGGVSNDVWRASDPVSGLDVVVKRSLPKLRVEEEWLASLGRTLVEAEALRLAGRLTLGLVPQVVDVDDSPCIHALRLPTNSESPVRRRRRTREGAVAG